MDVPNAYTSTITSAEESVFLRQPARGMGVVPPLLIFLILEHLEIR